MATTRCGDFYYLPDATDGFEQPDENDEAISRNDFYIMRIFRDNIMRCRGAYWVIAVREMGWYTYLGKYRSFRVFRVVSLGRMRGRDARTSSREN